MNAAIAGQILPDSVVLWLLVVVAGLAIWAHAAPRPLGAIIHDALKRARQHYAELRVKQ